MANRFFVTRAPQVPTGQDQEQWGRIHAAIIRLKWYFTRFRHLSVADLMQDFPGFCIPCRYPFLSLACCQEAKDPTGDVRCQRQRLEGCNDSIPAENRVVPRYAGIGIITLWGRGEKREEVMARAVDPVVELLVAGAHYAHFRFTLLE